MRIAIGMPTGGTIKTQTVTCLIDAMFSLSDVEKAICMPIGGYSCHARDILVERARQAEASHLLMIDADMVFPPDAIRKLINHDKDIVGYNYNERKLPLTSTLKLADKEGKLMKATQEDIPKELFKVHMVGFGMILIKMSVFDRIKPPYFRVEWNNEWVTEDYYFSRLTEAAGIDSWCDPTVHLLHIGDYLY